MVKVQFNNGVTTPYKIYSTYAVFNLWLHILIYRYLLHRFPVKNIKISKKLKIYSLEPIFTRP